MPDTTKQRQCKNCGLYESDADVKSCSRCGMKLYVVSNPDNPPAAQALADKQEAIAESSPPPSS